MKRAAAEIFIDLFSSILFISSCSRCVIRNNEGGMRVSLLPVNEVAAKREKGGT